MIKCGTDVVIRCQEQKPTKLGLHTLHVTVEIDKVLVLDLQVVGEELGTHPSIRFIRDNSTWLED